MDSPKPEEPSRLCDRCKVIELDFDQLAWLKVDRTHGGIATPTQFRNPPDGFVHLGQLLEDSFPELPALLRSAESGCEFCFLLRDVLTHSQRLAYIMNLVFQRNPSKEDPVLLSVRLRYQAVYACEDSPTGSTLSDTAGEEDADEEALDEEHLDEDDADEEDSDEEDFDEEDDGHEDAAEMSDTSEQTRPRPPLSEQSSMDYDSDSPSPILVLSAGLVIVESGQYITAFHFSVEGVRGYGSFARVLDAPIWPWSNDRFNSRYIEWIKANMTDCIETHGHTRTVQSFLPDRLIDVRQNATKLVSKEHIATGSTYAALSYCWGSWNDQLKTTRGTIRDMTTEILDENMTPVLYDAVQLTRKLGIPYLWIDALCILQDDDKDWNQNAANMHKIYGSAAITIAAWASESAGEHFRNARQRPVYLEFRPDRKTDLSGFYKVRFMFSYGGEPKAEHFSYRPVRNGEVECKWAFRGWTFQERLASTRILGFGRSELCFKCPEKSQCFGQDPCDPDPTGFLAQWGDNRIHGDETAEQWENLIMLYTERHAGFTRITDKLPAFSGVAALIGEKLGLAKEDYLAGIWRSQLSTGLMWHNISTKPQTLSQYISDLAAKLSVGPSWSWASAGEIDWWPLNSDLADRSSIRLGCKVEAKTETERGNQFGQVQSGSVFITSQVGSLNSDIEEVTYFFPRGLNEWTPAGQTKSWEFRLDWVPQTNVEPWGELKMVMLGTYQQVAKNNPTGEASVYGLLLHPFQSSHHAIPGKFYRVGTFRSAPGVTFLEENGLKFENNGGPYMIEII